MNEIIQLNVKIVKVNPLKASSYIELPEKYRHSSYGLINIRESDNINLKWSITRHFCTDESHPQRITKNLKDELQKLNFTNLELPMAVNKIYIFEKK